MPTDFAKLHEDVCYGRSGGRIIWQPRIIAWYGDKLWSHEPLPEPYTGMSLSQLYRALGCSNRIYDYNACFRAVEHPRVEHVRHKLNDVDTQITIHTPVGDQVAVHRTVKTSWYHIDVKREITTEAEMKVAAWRARHTKWAWDQKAFDRVHNEWGDLGAPTMFMPRPSMQDLYINTMGVENAIYAVADWPDTVRDYFAALEESHDRLIDVINGSPINIINFGDNVHAGTLSVELFKEFVLPVYRRRCEKLHRAGKWVHSHYDGDTKSLLPLAHDTGLDGIEAITPKPQGDVTLEEIKAGLGDDMFLLDGIPAVYFDTYYPLSVLEDCARRVIELFAPRLILGTSDEISSTGDVERVRAVGRIVDEYNASIGTPAAAV